uniref:C-type lectin domain-containing protein n=1 Tax=Sphaeramia orbicularis TaxID=375764 RepID=A0A672ZYE3_9TELE
MHTHTHTHTHTICPEKLKYIFIIITGLWCFSVGFIRTYTLVEVPLSWSNAQRFCRTEYTDLATAENKEEMQELVDAGRRWYGGHLWIGLYDDIHSWRWSMDEEGYYDAGGAEFRMWGASEPSNGNEKCALMFLAGTWHDISCQTKAPFVCYNGASPRFIVVSEVRTWPEAQSYCREHYTDLASVRNNSDNNQIKDLLSAEYTWIGLYRDSWKWSDRSPVSFTNWRNGKPGGLPCVLTHKGQWEDRRCDIKLFFVCQTGESSDEDETHWKRFHIKPG